MTYGIRQVRSVAQVRGGGVPIKFIFFNDAAWPKWAKTAFTYAIGCHYGHALEFLVALLCYRTVWAATFPRAGTLDFTLGGWISLVFAFHLVTELATYGFWHWMMYGEGSAPLRKYKYNPNEQYEGPDGAEHLSRERFYTTLGWLQAAALQCAVMYVWATGWGGFKHYDDFGSTPVRSVLLLAAGTYWREIHFYFVHRVMHPFWPDLAKDSPWRYADVGRALYSVAHSVHHKSYNPGPWSGMSMHPIEHLFYFSCAWLPLVVLEAHPLHFLYILFHACIAPIGGHDGHDEPGGGGGLHWLHHHRFDVNYGVPFPINFDALFGSEVTAEDFKASGGKSLAEARAYAAAKANAKAA